LGDYHFNHSLNTAKNAFLTDTLHPAKYKRGFLLLAGLVLLLTLINSNKVNKSIKNKIKIIKLKLIN